jgi:hypothetical protein
MNFRKYFSSFRMDVARDDVNKVKRSLTDEKTMTEIKNFFKGFVVIGDYFFPDWKGKCFWKIPVNGIIFFLVFSLFPAFFAYDLYKRFFVYGVFAVRRSEAVSSPSVEPNLDEHTIKEDNYVQPKPE